MTLLKKLVAVVLFSVVGMAQPALAQKYVCMESTQGQWCMQLLHDVAPNTVANFLRYVNDGRYANNIVHRSVPGFVIQAGGYDIDAADELGAVESYGTINNEFNRSNLRGTVAMAKLSGDPNSATSEWFVNLVDNINLDLAAVGSFTVFAEVVYGMDVFDKIAGLRVGDLSASFGTAFSEMPLDLPASANTVARENLVLITRAYTADLLPGSVVLPYHCTPDVPTPALTELCGSSVTFPVNIQKAGAYEVTLDIIASQPQLVLAVRADSLKPVAQLGDSFASYSDATGELIIPSVLIGGRIVDNVKLTLSNLALRQFTLQSFSNR